MATDGAGGPAGADEPRGRDARVAGRLAFRCHGCGVRFAGDAAGPGVCPRCGAIGGHERRGRAGDSDGASERPERVRGP